MVVLRGQSFHLVSLGHVHHFGPDPCGWSQEDIKHNILCIEIIFKKSKLFF